LAGASPIAQGRPTGALLRILQIVGALFPLAESFFIARCFRRVLVERNDVVTGPSM
jgi:hypothetical protein